MNRIRTAAVALVALPVAATPFSARAGEGDPWTFNVTPYVWLATVNADISDSGPPPASVITDNEFDDVLDKFDGALFIHAEGQGDHFGALADFSYLGLSQERERPRLRSETDFDGRLLDLAGVWSPGDDRFNGWDLFAGLRYVDTDFTVSIIPTDTTLNTRSLKTSKSYSDFLYGARYSWKAGDRWDFSVRGDGSTGSTNGTWSASAIAQYHMNVGQWVFGYRYLDLDFGEGTVDGRITLNGPVVGYGFNF
ncbi:hypothetical protein DWG18_05375 [Lysobacter sp. TY2-98]|uniref:hypothetical protein n=1 Tax=Lysobacter sp. TY2-98 TaxID=2290922 RepID=UPI000E203255|nr:hypothetical protein [Lysobacter sp. TY2-98]AXK71774.1 hypothetical protein DWG18_05375 [Lysobacter sp. TY2-98]